MKYRLLTFAFLSVILTACSSSPSTEGHRADPLESFNRTMWKVNYEYLDPYVLEPAAKGWRDYVPSPIKTGLTNVANNLDEPASFVNRLLEGEGRKAMVHFNRFWINSIFGLGGLIDFAGLTGDLNAENGRRTFGDTLGRYHVPTGTYIMLPGYGAATPRQDLGGLVDTTYPVLSLLATPWSIAKFTVQGIDKRASLLGQDALLKQAQDPYVTFREAYFQNLSFKVNDGKMQDEQEQLSDEDLKGID